jgi:hypothetical protein
VTHGGNIEKETTGVGLPSRRALLRTAGTAAWTVPAIVAVGAAPAFAASGDGGAITFDPGSTYLIDGGSFYYPYFDGFTVSVPEPVGPGLLTMRATIPADVYQEAGGTQTAPDGWAFGEGGMNGSGYDFIYTYLAAASPGTPISFGDGVWFGSERPGPGTFTMLLSAPGLTSAVYQLSRSTATRAGAKPPIAAPAQGWSSPTKQ